MGDTRVVVPTREEILRVKAWLLVSRNQTRDYLDVAALTDTIGIHSAASTLCVINDYYADLNRRPEAVATQVTRQLADPRPRDPQVIDQLARNKSLAPRWHDWSSVVAVLADVAEAMTR